VRIVVARPVGELGVAVHHVVVVPSSSAGRETRMWSSTCDRLLYL